MKVNEYKITLNIFRLKKISVKMGLEWFPKERKQQESTAF